MICEGNEYESKWCHRASQGDDQPCIGPKCMAWVWDNEDGRTFSINPLTDEYRVLTKEEQSTPAAQMGMQYVLDGEPTGHCGLVDHGK